MIGLSMKLWNSPWINFYCMVNIILPLMNMELLLAITQLCHLWSSATLEIPGMKEPTTLS